MDWCLGWSRPSIRQATENGPFTGVILPPPQSNCFPVTVAASCCNLVLRTLSLWSFYEGSCEQRFGPRRPHFLGRLALWVFGFLSVTLLLSPLLQFSCTVFLCVILAHLRVNRRAGTQPPSVNLFPSSCTWGKSFHFLLFRAPFCLCSLWLPLPNRKKSLFC